MVLVAKTVLFLNTPICSFADCLQGVDRNGRLKRRLSAREIRQVQSQVVAVNGLPSGTTISTVSGTTVSTASVADLAEHQNHHFKFKDDSDTSFVSTRYDPFNYGEMGGQFKSWKEYADLAIPMGDNMPVPEHDWLPTEQSPRDRISDLVTANNAYHAAPPIDFQSALDIIHFYDQRGLPDIDNSQVIKVGGRLKKRTDQKFNPLAPPPPIETGSTLNDNLGSSQLAPSLTQDGDTAGAAQDGEVKCTDCFKPVLIAGTSCISCVSLRSSDVDTGSSS